MCLLTKQQKPIKLRKDRTVYKVIYLGGKNGDKIFPMYYTGDFEYKLGELNETEFSFIPPSDVEAYSFDNATDRKYGYLTTRQSDPESCEGLLCIATGFHSATTSKRYGSTTIKMAGMIRCTIPKGSLVYKDETGLLVSNKIIVNEIIEWKK